MITVNIHQAKTQLSQLLKQVSSGKEVIIAKAGEPVAKLVEYKAEQKPRKPGALKGKIWIADDFDDESDEINKMFYGKK